ncbi:MAG: prepilin-type N-cleavage/methylation domain protein [Pseudomonadota bacterium]|jgi:type IV pilus assembly protein PilW
MKPIERGYSLLELLVALTLALFLSSGMINIFIQSKHIYQLTQNLNEIQINARTAINALSHDIRMAGLIGCVRLIDFLPRHSHLTPDTSLVVWHNGQTTAKLALPKLARYRQDGDVILIQSMNPNTIPIRFAKDGNISLMNRAAFAPNDSLLISDCQHAEVFNWGHKNLKYIYQLGSELGFFDKIIYYIADTGRISETGQGIYALYRRNLNRSVKKPIELVEGIEKMSIRLGIKDAHGNLNYTDADKVKRWSDARSVEIKLCLTNKKKIRREWQYIVALREREAYD